MNAFQHTIPNKRLRAYLSFEMAKDANLIEEMMHWCEQNFGLGCKNILNIIGSSEYQWSVNKTIFHNVFFEFRTQQQLDWFTLKWL